MNEAVQVALQSNPEIGQAIANREAIEFELRQSRSLYLPRVDAQASTGLEQLDNPSRRALGIDNREHGPRDVGIFATWSLFDGFGREAEIEKQASRVDSASFRVFDRSELIALAIARDYIEIILQTRVLAFAEQNLQFHKAIKARISDGLRGGNLTAADDKQASERLKSAEARIIQVKEDLDAAKIAFFRQVGVPPGPLKVYPRLTNSAPSNLEHAIHEARNANPRIKAAQADLDAAHASVRSARSNYLPKVSVEGSARTGEDIDGVDDRTSDMQVKLVTKWNLFAGGGDLAREQEQIRRLTEARMQLETAEREIQESLSNAWNSRRRQAELAETLKSQAVFGKDVVGLYDQQFKAGKRTLLDLLSAQNSYFSVQVLAATSEHARDLADYRLLASTGQLLVSLGVAVPAAADAYAREAARVPSTPVSEEYRRIEPGRR